MSGYGSTGHAIPRSTKIVRCPAVQTNVRWPAPVDQRLNELALLLNRRGMTVTRSQLLAALVVGAESDVAALEKIVKEYFDETAGGVVLQRRGGIQVGDRHPGRRPLT